MMFREAVVSTCGGDRFAFGVRAEEATYCSNAPMSGPAPLGIAAPA